MKGSKNEVEIYPGTHHGFAFPKRPVYHRDAAERHWERLLALYRRNLVPESPEPMPFLTIAFPVFDPIAISIGPIAIRWYALAYIGGIVLGWIYARSLVKNEKLWGGPAPITLVQLDDFILWVTIGIIVGGRTGYVLFYNPAFFMQHPAEIFELWKGGMSFHGGFLGCVAAVILFCRRNDISDPLTRRHHHRRSGRSDCSSAGSPTSSTASCGAGRRIPACPGRWCSPMADRCHGTPASSMRPGSRASCYLRSWQS